MKVKAIQRRQLAELLVGVVPAAIFFTPFLLLLTMALILEIIPGLSRGKPLSEDGMGLVLLLMGPIGLLALASLIVLIFRGPEHVAKDRLLKILVVGSGIPALMFSVYVLSLQIFDPRARAEGGQLVWVLSLAASTLVGLRYLRFLPLLFPRPAGARGASESSSRTRPSRSRRASRSARSRARPSRPRRA